MDKSYCDGNPWLGLQTYSEGSRLYGRKKDVDALSLIIFHSVATVLYGRSGIGKSSLIHAGLFPVIRAGGSLPIYVRFEHNTDEPYDRQIISAVSSGVKLRDRLPHDVPVDGLWDFFHRFDFLDDDGIPQQLVVVIDQFEEIYTLADDIHRGHAQILYDEFASLFNNIKPDRIIMRDEKNLGFSDSNILLEGVSAVKVPVPSSLRPAYKQFPDVRFVISLREDYLYYLERNTSRIPSLRINRYALRALDEQGAKDVIILPIPGFYSDSQAEDIIGRIAFPDENDSLQVDPTILSIFLYRSFASGGSTGTDDIIGEFYHDETASISEETLSFIEGHLLTGQGFRQAVPYGDAIEMGASARELSKLIESRILISESRRKCDYIEFSHDVLCPVAKMGRDTRVLRAQKRKLKRRITLATIAAALISVLVVVFFTLIHLVNVERAKVDQLEVYNSSVQAGIFARDGKVFDAIRLLLGTVPKDFSGGSILPETESALYETYDSLSAAYACIAQLRHGDDVNSAVYDYDGEKIVTACSDGSLYLWSASGENLNRLEGHTSRANYAEFSRDGRYVVSASSDSTAIIWSLPDGNVKSTLRGHSGAVLFASFSPDGRYITTSGADGTVRLWDAGTGSQIRTIAHYGGEATSCHFYEDSRRIVSSSLDGSMSVIDLYSGAEAPVSYGRSMLDYACFNAEGSLILYVSGSGIVILDAVSGVKVKSLAAAEDVLMSNANFDIGGDRVAYCCSDGSVGIWDWKQDNSVIHLRGHDLMARYVTFSPDGKHLLSAGRDNLVRIWNLEGSESVVQCNEYYAPFATFNCDGSLIASSSIYGVISLWRNACGIYELSDTMQLHSFATSISFNREGTALATTLFDKTVRLYDLNSGIWRQPSHTFHSNFCKAVFEYGSNSVIAISNDSPSVRWDYTADSIEMDCFKDGRSLNDLVFSPDGRMSLMIQTGSRDAMLRSTSAPCEDLSLTGHTDEIQCAAFSPDGRYAATGSSDCDVIIWDVELGERVATLKGHLSQVYFVQFTPDGRYLYSSSTDGTVRIWNIETARTVRRFENTSLTRMENVFSEGGRRMLVPIDRNLVIVDSPSVADIVGCFKLMTQYE